MSRTVKKGATSQTLYFEILDSTSSTGGRKTGLVFNTSLLTAYYVRNGGSAVAITLATLAAANSAWSSGGFKEVDATNMPGIYRVDVPDAAFASGAESVIVTLKGATGMAQVSAEVQLNDNTAGDIFARLGAPAGASVSADVAAVKTDTAAVKVQTDKMTFTVAGMIDSNVIDWKGATAPAMTGDAYARLGAPAGASTAADVAAVKALLPSALVGGKIDANIGSVTAGVIAAAAFAAGALDAVWSTAARVLTAGTNIVLAKGTGITGFNDVTAASIWDVVLSGHLTAGTTGNALNAAGSAGDPWSTTLPGAYGAGSAGNIIGNRLDAAITTRLASASYTAPDNASVTAIKAKTDNLPAAPADETLIIAATNSLAGAIAALPTANTNADALLDRTAGVETGWTLRQAMRIVLSVLAGKASGLETTTAVYRDMADAKNRVTATVDANGNRTAVTRDAS